jgi:PAS domain S-box-containing protein
MPAPSSPAVNDPDFPAEVVRRALSEARRALGMEIGFFTEFLEDYAVVRCLDGEIEGLGWSEDQVLPRTDTFCHRMLTGTMRCWVPDVALDPVAAAAPAAASGVQAYIGVPVHHADGRLYGSLCCASRTPRPELEERDERILHALAGVIAGQLDHARRYQHVLETAKEPIWVTNLDGRTVFANEPLARLLGVTRDSLQGRSAFDFLSGAAADRARTALADRETGVMERYELEFTRPDGSALPVEVSGAPLTDAEDRVIGTVATLLDLSERKAAERLSEARFQWLADLVPQQIWIADPDGAISFVNARVHEYYGPGAVLAHTSDWRTHLHPDDTDAPAAIAERRAAGERYTFTARLRRHDGEYREHVARAYPMHDDAGTLVRWYGVTTDVTGRRAQERLVESERRLREAQHIARLGSVTWTREHGREYSDEFLALLGLQRGEVGDEWEAFLARIHPEDRERFIAERDRAMAACGAAMIDHRIVLPGGEERVLHHEALYIPGPDGLAASMTGTVQDVTEQRAAELAARGREAAERANRAKSEFLSRMSHELRTPLNAILGFGQLLELDALTADQHDSVSHILKGGAHLLELINEVLEISRIEAGALRLSLESIPISSAIRDVTELLSPLAAERDVTLVLDAGTTEDPHVRADLQRSKQVLLNLISNAIKYNRSGGMVTVRVRPAGDGRTRVIVSDTGLGLRPEELERAFDPFERLSAADGGTEGTGLGLSLSRSLAEAMGGELTAASELGCGCDFAFVLDTAVAPPVDEPTEDERPVEAGDEAIHVSRVLYVEDNPSNMRLVERVLSRAGIAVIGAPQGRLGVDLARRHLPDAVLLDLDLPDISGEVVMAELAADPATARIPVIICSADATPSTVQRLRADGAREYLTKPLDVARLLKTVRELTDGVAT